MKAAVALCQDEIIVEINSRIDSNENSDVDNGDILLQYDDDEEDEETNSEQKLLKSNHFEEIKAQVEIKFNGKGDGGINDICLKMKLGL